MDTTTQSPTPRVETHCFLFNVQTFPDPLTPFSTSEWNNGEESVLKARQYERVPGGPEHIELYVSTFASAKYLIIMRVPGYRFIFYVEDDASLQAWQSRFQSVFPALLIKQLLPPPPSQPKMIQIPMNLRALRGGW